MDGSNGGFCKGQNEVMRPTQALPRAGSKEGLERLTSVRSTSQVLITTSSCTVVRVNYYGYRGVQAM